MNENKMIKIGVTGAAVGIKGEIRLQLYSGDSRNIEEDTVLYLAGRRRRAEDAVSYAVTSVRIHKGVPVVKFEGIGDRNGAEQLRGMDIYMPEDEFRPTEEGFYYVKDLIGLTVYDRMSDSEIGRVDDVLTNTGQPVYSVKRQSGAQVLIPAVDAFVKDIDLPGGRIEVELIEGFLDED